MAPKSAKLLSMPVDSWGLSRSLSKVPCVFFWRTHGIRGFFCFVAEFTLLGITQNEFTLHSGILNLLLYLLECVGYLCTLHLPFTSIYRGWVFLFCFTRECRSLKSMENTRLSCPDMLGISKYVLTHFFDNQLNPHLWSICCVPGLCDPKLRGRGLP